MEVGGCGVEPEDGASITEVTCCQPLVDRRYRKQADLETLTGIKVWRPRPELLGEERVTLLTAPVWVGVVLADGLEPTGSIIGLFGGLAPGGCPRGLSSLDSTTRKLEQSETGVTVEVPNEHRPSVAGDGDHGGERGGLNSDGPEPLALGGPAGVLNDPELAQPKQRAGVFGVGGVVTTREPPGGS